MHASLEQLKQYPIISSEEIEALHRELQTQHPLLNEKERAQLFAQSIHQKLDAALAPFDPETQLKLKRQLLTQTVQKSNFCINALDLFESYTQVESPTPSNMEPLTTWLNEQEHLKFTNDHLFHMAQAINSNLEPQIAETTASCASILSNDASTIEAPLELPSRKIPSSFRTIILLFSLTIVGASLFISNHYSTQATEQTPTTLNDDESMPTILPTFLPTAIKMRGGANALQSHLQYKMINKPALQKWLKSKHSLLADEPYFSTIIHTAESFNINPLLLFAITGQEQNFVPDTHASAQKMANNPFNLYGSWQDYNTSIEDSARIAARTVIHLAEDCPEQENQIQWINQQYAADPNWHVGVTYFLNQMEEVASLSNH